MVFDLVQS